MAFVEKVEAGVGSNVSGPTGDEDICHQSIFPRSLIISAVQAASMRFGQAYNQKSAQRNSKRLIVQWANASNPQDKAPIQTIIAAAISIVSE
jgi:hypothetical protein